MDQDGPREAATGDGCETWDVDVCKIRKDLANLSQTDIPENLFVAIIVNCTFAHC